MSGDMREERQLLQHWGLLALTSGGYNVIGPVMLVGLGALLSPRIHCRSRLTVFKDTRRSMTDGSCVGDTFTQGDVSWLSTVVILRQVPRRVQRCQARQYLASPAHAGPGP